MVQESEKYQEFVECEAHVEGGVLFIKVITLPHLGAVEFDTKQARIFAAQILSAAEKIEKQWDEWNPRPGP